MARIALLAVVLLLAAEAKAFCMPPQDPRPDGAGGYDVEVARKSLDAFNRCMAQEREREDQEQRMRHLEERQRALEEKYNQSDNPPSRRGY